MHQGAGVSGVGCGGQAAPDAGLLQGQAQAGQSPLEVHAQRNLVLEQTPRHHLEERGGTGGERGDIQGREDQSNIEVRKRWETNTSAGLCRGSGS